MNNSTTKSIEINFNKQAKLIAQDLTIASLCEEIEIKELEHKVKLLQRAKQLAEMNVGSISEAFYERFHVAWMEAEVNPEVSITSHFSDKKLFTTIPLLKIKYHKK